MAEPLWILGASVRAAAQSARRAGYDVRAADLFADGDTRAVAEATRVDDYPQGFGALVRSRPAPWMVTGALENYPEFIEELARVAPLLGNGAGVVRAARDPRRLYEALTREGLARPRLIDAEERPPSDSARWLRKPRRSAAGRKIEFVEPNHTPEPGGDAYIQEYIAGTPCALTCLAAGGETRLWLISEQLIGAEWTGGSGFHYCGSIGPLTVSQEAIVEAERIGDCLSQAFGLQGIFGVDCILADRDGRLYPIEVNPRYTASVELWEQLSRASAVAAHVAACRQGRLSGTSHRDLAGARAGKAIVYARRDAKLDAARAAELARWNATPRSYRLADLPHFDPADTRQGIEVAAGSPIVTVLVEGASRDAVLRSLQEAVADFESWLHQE